MKYYTGVGSRKTPQNEFDLLVKVGYFLAEQGWTLRSGAADGADTAFEEGCDTHAVVFESTPRKEIYVAWQGFSNRTSKERGCICL